MEEPDKGREDRDGDVATEEEGKRGGKRGGRRGIGGVREKKRKRALVCQ